MFGKLFGGKGKSGGDETSIIRDNDPRIAAGYARLKAAWDQMGPSDPDVITYLLNPQFQGKPAWPNTRQAYRIVRPPSSLIIASDGLSDPFVNTDMTDAQGLGCEVYVEAPELAGANFETLRGSWAFSLIENFAMNVADWGGISRQLAANGILSLELPAQDVLPEHWLTPNGNAGFLVGVTGPGRPQRLDDMPFGPVDLIALTLVTPAELERIVAGGAEARRQVASELAAQGLHHTTRLGRLTL